jgi:TetR/AcrR family transcriptional regulator of autoinduction and epiphytic fitness
VDVIGTSQEVDGRHLRREQNREAVLDALIELFTEGFYQPGANEIAERAGISPRSLFRYFDDIDDLNRAAIEHQLTAVRPHFDIDIAPDAPTKVKIERLAAARVRLFEAIAPAARAARGYALSHPVVARNLRETRARLRDQVQRLFAPELGGDRVALLAVLDALCSFETCELLRFDQGLSRSKAVSALVSALTALLEPSTVNART